MVKSAKLNIPKPEVTFDADHPFITTILSRSNNVFFMGRLSEL